MSNSTVSKRYGRALFDLANEKDLIDEFQEELQVIKKVFETEEDLVEILKSPKISLENKKQLVTKIFPDVHSFLKSTLMLVIERKREQYIPGIAAQFIELANEAKGIAEAVVYTTRPLTDSESESISKTFAKKVGKESLLINNIIDENLLGGVKLQVGNKIFDGSIRGKIDRLERKLLLG